MFDLIYLGRVKYVHDTPGNNYHYATIEPLLQSSTDKKHWLGPIENPIEEFPGRGLVHWHDSEKGLQVGDMIQFDVALHPYYKGEPDKEQLVVRSHKHPTEILDFRKIGSEHEIRVLLTTNGLFLPTPPLRNRCILWLEKEKWVGPVELSQNELGSWILPSTQNLDLIRRLKIPPEAIDQVPLDYTRYLLAPNSDNSIQYIGYINWLPNDVLAKRIFDHLRKNDPKTAQALQISKNVFKAYIETIKQAGITDPTLSKELAFRDRVHELLEEVSKNEELLTEAAEACFSISPVKKKLEKAAEEEYKKKLKEYETRLNEDFKSKEAELWETTNRIYEKKEELAATEKRIRSLDAELSLRTSEFDEELEKRLHALAEKPKQFFTEVAVTNGLVGIFSNKHRRKRRGCSLPPSDVPIIKDTSTFIHALTKKLLSSRLSPMIGQALHAALLSGLIPVLIGPDSYRLVSCYAECVSGRILHWIPVGGTLFEPTDLLAKFDPVSGCLVPHAGGLLDLLLDDSDAVHIVVLEGFNRAAVEGYLIPLLQSAEDVAQGRDPRSIPIAPSAFGSDDDPYAGVYRIPWNHRVLMVLCPAQGSSTMPVSSELWKHCVVPDAADPAPLVVGTETSHEITRVPVSVWQRWAEEVKGKSTDQLKAIREVPEGVSWLPNVIVDNVERMYRSARVLGLKEQNAFERSLKVALFPYLSATEEPLDIWLQHLKISYNESDRRIFDAIRRLGE